VNWAISTWTGTIPFDQGIPTPAVTISYDADTLAWVAAVGSGNVTTGRKNLIDALIVGLKANGIWTKLDRLWLFAAENTTCALVDIKGLATATEINSPPFAPNVGYTGVAGPGYIDSNFDPSIASTPQYVQNSACLLVWCNTTGVNTSNELAGNGSDATLIIPRQSGLGYFPINETGANYGNSGTVADSQGLFHCDRDGASSEKGYMNGSAVASSTNGSAAPTGKLLFCRGLFGGTLQVSCGGFGSSLNATEAGNLYTRLRTYMTGVGVP
jgi:hypothetical protein